MVNRSHSQSSESSERCTPVLVAWGELGSAVSRNRPGARHVVRLSGPTRSLIVAGGLSETAAGHLAEAINSLIADSVLPTSQGEPESPRW